MLAGAEVRRNEQCCKNIGEKRNDPYFTNINLYSHIHLRAVINTMTIFINNHLSLKGGILFKKKKKKHLKTLEMTAKSKTPA